MNDAVLTPENYQSDEQSSDAVVASSPGRSTSSSQGDGAEVFGGSSDNSSVYAEYGAEVLKILLIEDDDEIADYAVNGLSQAGHKVDAVVNGEEGLARSKDAGYDLLVIDRMLPGMDGLSMIKAARACGVDTPALFLTSLSGVEDRVAGLEAGANDYLTKPFAFSELLARVNALGREPAVSSVTDCIAVGDLTIDLTNGTVVRAGVKIELLPKEYSLLAELMKNEGRVVSRAMLLEKVWDFYFDPKTRVVETHISRLKAKIDDPFDTPLLHEHKKVGYSLYVPRTAVAEGC